MGGRELGLAAPTASKLEKSLSNISSYNSSPHKIPSCELFPETRPCKHGGSTKINISRTVIPPVITAFVQTLFFPTLPGDRRNFPGEGVTLQAVGTPGPTYQAVITSR